MRFQVLVDGEPRPVELTFGGEKDLALVSRWRAPAVVAGHPAVRDTLEFAQLASKRWRYYRRSIATATSIASFKSIIARGPQAEVSLLLLVRADWFARSRILGLAQCRRTYCHHLVIEFLSVHPAIVGGASPRVRGVGAGILFSLAELAGSVGVPLIWGEATAHSAAFYAKTCRIRKVQDPFSFGKNPSHFAGINSAPKHSASLENWSARLNTSTMTKAEMVKKLERAYACEDYFPGVLGNPVTFAARYGLPLSKSYLKFKERELRAANRRGRAPARRKNSAAQRSLHRKAVAA